MGAVVEQLIRHSDVQIRLQLTEDGLPTFGAWDSLEIYIGDVLIERAADGDGVELSTATGILVITPANLTALEKTALDALNYHALYRVRIVVFSTLNDDGVVFGGSGSTHILFKISDRPG